MGLLSALFGKDHSAELDRAEVMCTDGNPVLALELAEKIARKANSELAPRAEQVLNRARTAVRDSVLAKADAAEAAGNHEDAADWLEAAIENETSAMARADLAERRRLLLGHTLELPDDLIAEVMAAEAAEAVEPSSDESFDVDLETRYAIHLDTLSEAIAPQYESRSTEFQQALVDFNEGQVSEAMEVFLAQLEEHPEDPILQLETGRGHLFAGNGAAAKESLEAAWQQFGDGPLDATESSSIPALWAEAALMAGDSQEVVERLQPLADPEGHGHSEICKLYAQALIAVPREQDARSYLETCVRMMPRDFDFPFLLAQLLTRSGEIDRAIVYLESTVSKSCTTGCSSPGMHLPSLQALAQLYAADGRNPERARELTTMIASQVRG